MILLRDQKEGKQMKQIIDSEEYRRVGMELHEWLQKNCVSEADKLLILRTVYDQINGFNHMKTANEFRKEIGC